MPKTFVEVIKKYCVLFENKVWYAPPLEEIKVGDSVIFCHFSHKNSNGVFVEVIQKGTVIEIDSTRNIRIHGLRLDSSELGEVEQTDSWGICSEWREDYQWTPFVEVRSTAINLAMKLFELRERNQK